MQASQLGGMLANQVLVAATRPLTGNVFVAEVSARTKNSWAADYFGPSIIDRRSRDTVARGTKAIQPIMTILLVSGSDGIGGIITNSASPNSSRAQEVLLETRLLVVQNWRTTHYDAPVLANFRYFEAHPNNALVAGETIKESKSGADVSLLEALLVDQLTVKDSDISAAIEGLSHLLNEGQFHTIDALMSDLDEKQIAIEMMITLLRVSFSARHKIVKWKSFLDRCAGELRSRGRNPDRVFRGLGAA